MEIERSTITAMVAHTSSPICQMAILPFDTAGSLTTVIKTVITGVKEMATW